MKKLYLIFFVVFVGTYWLSSQEPLKHEKKVYVSPEGRIFIQKSLPIYLRLSTSPKEDAKSYLLKSEVTKKYSNPMYLDTEGYNTFRSPWIVDTTTLKPLYPRQDIIFEVYSDSKSPITSINYGKASVFKLNGKVYINIKGEITLEANDQISGVENIYYSMDGSNFQVFSTPLIINQEKEYMLKYYAVDNVGNVENLHSVNIILDKTNPKTSINISTDKYENIISGRSKIILEAEDSGVGIKSVFYKIDEGPEKKYITPLRVTYLSQGEHKLIYYTSDKVNNNESENVFNFYIDKTPPNIVQEIIGKSFFAGGKEYSSGRSQLKLTTFDNKAGVKDVFYSINNTEYKKYEKPVFLSNVTGNLVIKAYAIDNVNNKTESVEKGSKTNVPYVDLSGPSITHGFSGSTFILRDTVFISNTTKIYLKATDTESGINRIEYIVDDKEIKVFKEPFSIDKEGPHSVEITGYDNVDNTSINNFSVIVDKTGPVVFSRFSVLPNGKENFDGKILDNFPGHVVLFLSSTDNVVGFDKMYYSINDTPEKRYYGIIKSFPGKGKFNMKIRAQDKLGNETKEEIDFSISN